MKLTRHQEAVVDPVGEQFDRLFDEWMSVLPFRRPALFARSAASGALIRVDEYRDEGELVVKAELPGIDPEKDVELSVTDGVLRIEAERREEAKAEEKGYVRRELRYGSFARTLPLPGDVSEGDIKATYKDGILEIRVPTGAPPAVKRIAIAKT